MNIGVRTWLVIVLIIGIVLVESGVRPALAPGDVAITSVPHVAERSVERLRSAPRASGQPPNVQAVMAGMIFGRTDDVTSADQQAFLASGLWHLLAASGQNVALVIGMCLLAARAIGASRTTGSVAALLAVPAYVIVVGGGASIVRAGIMGELALLSWLSGRLRTTGHAMLVAACLTVWLWPGAHRTLGWQLSFACVAAMVACTRQLAAVLRPWLRSEALAVGTAVTLLCSLATAPILMWSKGSAPLLGAVANLIAVPLASIVLVVGLAGSLLWMLFPLIGSPMLHVAGWCAHLEVTIAHVAAALPAAQTDSRVVAYGIPAACACISGAPRAHRRMIAIASLSLLCAALGVGWMANSPAFSRFAIVRALPGGVHLAPVTDGALRIVALDVGQGDATLIARRDHAIVIDVGPPDGDVVDRIVEAGVGRLDGVILTHDSLDHRGAIAQVVERFGPRWIVVPRDAPGYWGFLSTIDLPRHTVCDGDEVPFGDVIIDIRNPPCSGSMPNLTGDVSNDNAIVSLIVYRAARVLVSADAEGLVTSRLGLPPLDVLRVGHHGSRDAGLERLLEQVRPHAAIISVGRNNSYGHPTRSTLDVLQHAHVRTYRTDLDGSVVVDIDGATGTVSMHGST